MHDLPTIYLIDDETQFVKGVVSFAASIQIRVECVASAYDFLQQRLTHPACVMIDVSNPKLGGDVLIESLSISQLPLPLIVLAEDQPLELIVRAAREGAIAVLQKNSVGTGEFYDAIQAALAKDSENWREQQDRSVYLQNFGSLTEFELRILDPLIAGTETQSIASQFNVNRRTIERSRNNLMVKLGVKTFPELIALVSRFGKPTA